MAQCVEAWAQLWTDTCRPAHTLPWQVLHRRFFHGHAPLLLLRFGLSLRGANWPACRFFGMAPRVPYAKSDCSAPQIVRTGRAKTEQSTQDVDVTPNQDESLVLCWVGCKAPEQCSC